MHETHREAAEKHELAAHSHRTAAEHHEKGDYSLQRGSDHAYRLAKEAHAKSGRIVSI
jgi:hypothetical protein